MYRVTAEIVSGSKVFAGGKWLKCIGNKRVSVGERIWTDGRCVYGHFQEAQQPPVITSGGDEAIPILAGKQCYIFYRDKLQLIGELDKEYSLMINDTRGNVLIYADTTDLKTAKDGDTLELLVSANIAKNGNRYYLTLQRKFDAKSDSEKTNFDYLDDPYTIRIWKNGAVVGKTPTKSLNKLALSRCPTPPAYAELHDHDLDIFSRLAFIENENDWFVEHVLDTGRGCYLDQDIFLIGQYGGQRAYVWDESAGIYRPLSYYVEKYGGVIDPNTGFTYKIPWVDLYVWDLGTPIKGETYSTAYCSELAITTPNETQEILTVTSMVIVEDGKTLAAGSNYNMFTSMYYGKPMFDNYPATAELNTLVDKSIISLQNGFYYTMDELETYQRLQASTPSIALLLVRKKFFSPTGKELFTIFASPYIRHMITRVSDGYLFYSSDNFYFDGEIYPEDATYPSESIDTGKNMWPGQGCYPASLYCNWGLYLYKNGTLELIYPSVDVRYTTSDYGVTSPHFHVVGGEIINQRLRPMKNYKNWHKRIKEINLT